jgi:hypothetical protein
MNHFWCEKCDKIVPQEEVSYWFALNDKAIHVYYKTINAYKYQSPGKIGYCPQKETVICGNVREPTCEEYFYYHVCQAKS